MGELEREVVRGFLFQVLDCLAWQPMQTVNAFAPTIVAMLAAAGVTTDQVMECVPRALAQACPALSHPLQWLTVHIARDAGLFCDVCQVRGQRGACEAGRG